MFGFIKEKYDEKTGANEMDEVKTAKANLLAEHCKNPKDVSDPKLTTTLQSSDGDEPSVVFVSYKLQHLFFISKIKFIIGSVLLRKQKIATRKRMRKRWKKLRPPKPFH